MSDNAQSSTTALAVVAPVPGTPARVMKAGQALSPEVAQALAADVERTFRREVIRRRTSAMTAIGGVGSASLSAFVGLVRFGNSIEEVAFVTAAMVAAPLALHLLWGARNRALLDVAAANGAVSRMVLIDAVQRMQREDVGPSTALRDALTAHQAP